MTDKKRILLLTRPICPPWDEGSKNFAFTLAKYTSDFEVHLLTHGNVADLPKNVVQHDIYSSPKLDLMQKIRLYKFLKKTSDYDIVHSLFTPTKINSFFIKRAFKNKSAKFVQTVATLREDLYSDEDLKKVLFGDSIITYSDYAKEKLEKLNFKNVKRIFPGIDISLYSPAPKNQELMKKFKTSADDFVINYTGEYVRLEDMNDIVGAFLDLVRVQRKFKLHLAVRVKNEIDALKKREVIEKFKKEDVLDRVAFIDDGSYEMQDIFNLCDISIFPAHTMAGKFDIPLAIIEAMACGKAVIASNIEKLKYFLNRENSLPIPPGNREVLKENILYLYNNPEIRYDLEKKGMKFVHDNFDIMNIVKKYEEVYKNL